MSRSSNRALGALAGLLLGCACALAQTPSPQGSSSGGGGTPGGSNTQLQYNNSGAFGGVSGVTSNGTAVAGSDYVAANGTLVFTNGVTNEAFTVTVVDSEPTVRENAGMVRASPACRTMPVISLGWKPLATTFTV